MNQTKEYNSVAGAARDFFDTPPYPSAQAFMNDWKEMTVEDKKEIKEGLQQIGYKINTPD